MEYRVELAAVVLCVVSLQSLPRRVRLCSAWGQYITRKSATGFALALNHVTSTEMVCQQVTWSRVVHEFGTLYRVAKVGHCSRGSRVR